MTVGVAFALGAGIGALIHPLTDIAVSLLVGGSPFYPEES